MQKIAKLTILSLFILLFSFQGARAEVACPLGLDHDPAPGVCSLYIDKDGSDFCDLSENPRFGQGASQASAKKALSEEELKQLTVGEAAEYFGIPEEAYADVLAEFIKKPVSSGDSLQALHDNNGLCAGVAVSLANGLKDGKKTDELDPKDLVSGTEIYSMKVYEVAELYRIDENRFASALADVLGVKVRLTETIRYYHDSYGLEASQAKDLAASITENGPGIEAKTAVAPVPSSVEPRYKFVLILSLTVLLYLLTSVLSARKKISVLQHRRFWNLILFFSFLLSGLLGLLLIIRINWGWYIALPFSLLYWHVEIGTVMLLVSFAHIGWHIGYFKAMFRKRKVGDAKADKD